MDSSSVFDFKLPDSAGCRDLDFSVPELNLLQDHISNPGQTDSDFLGNDTSTTVHQQIKSEDNNRSPKRKRTCLPEMNEIPELSSMGTGDLADIDLPPSIKNLFGPSSFFASITNKNNETNDDACSSKSNDSQDSNDIKDKDTKVEQSEETVPAQVSAPNGEETSEEKQERIRRRNREHARKCRIRKRQAADSLAARVKHLEQEYTKLMRAFRVVYNSKALMASLVVSEFGDRGSVIVERTNKLTLVSDRVDILSASAAVL